MKMADMANFQYQGNAVLDLKRVSAAMADKPISPRKIEVQKVVHLIPIRIHCTQGGDPMVVTAYMDYTSNTVEIPPSSLREIDDPDQFKSALVGYVRDVILPQDHEQANLSPDDMEEVRGVLDTNQNPARHTVFANNQGIDPNDYLQDGDEEDDEDAV